MPGSVAANDEMQLTAKRTSAKCPPAVNTRWSLVSAFGTFARKRRLDSRHRSAVDDKLTARDR